MIDMRIPISMDDIRAEIDTESKLKDLLVRPNYARAFLFLAIQLVNNEKPHITVIEAANAINRARSQAQEILNRFSSIGVLNVCHKGTRIYYQVSDPTYFDLFWQLAKTTIDTEASKTETID